MKKLSSTSVVFFLLLAIAAFMLMGATAEKPAMSALHDTALRMAQESSENVRISAQKLAIEQPEAVLRANVIKR